MAAVYKVDQKVQDRIILEIIQERIRQDEKFGPRNKHTPERWLTILAEEFGEVSTAILNHDLENYYEELVQVAAVAVAALECLCITIAEDERKK